jgi:hypothetical protein
MSIQHHKLIPKQSEIYGKQESRNSGSMQDPKGDYGPPGERTKS